MSNLFEKWDADLINICPKSNNILPKNFCFVNELWCLTIGYVR